MSEWNAQLAAGLAQNLGSALEVWAPDFWQLFRMAEGEHKAADALRALLAQREGELEALRGKISEAEEWLREDDDNCGNCHYAAQMAVAAANDGLASMPAYPPSCDFHEGAHRLLSALSDNPESPALTDKEA